LPSKDVGRTRKTPYLTHKERELSWKTPYLAHRVREWLILKLS